MGMNQALRSIEDRLAPYALYIGAVSGMVATLAIVIGNTLILPPEHLQTASIALISEAKAEFDPIYVPDLSHVMNTSINLPTAFPLDAAPTAAGNHEAGNQRG